MSRLPLRRRGNACPCAPSSGRDIIVRPLCQRGECMSRPLFGDGVMRVRARHRRERPHRASPLSKGGMHVPHPFAPKGKRLPLRAIAGERHHRPPPVSKGGMHVPPPLRRWGNACPCAPSSGETSSSAPFVKGGNACPASLFAEGETPVPVRPL